MGEHKKIALISNGVTDDHPDALEAVLRKQNQEIDVFDVRNLHKISEGFEDVNTGKLVDTAGYSVVVRSIQGGNSGDTDKSWELQKLFEDSGAKPYATRDAARNVTDKILCKNKLSDKNIKAFPSLAIGKDEDKNPQTIETEIKALGEPPYVVRKNIGSSRDSFAIAESAEDAIKLINEYRNPTTEGVVGRGAIVHKLPKTLNAETIKKYKLDDVVDAEKCSYQFRIILVDGQVFGANICYSEPNNFGLNPAQGATFKPIDEAKIPQNILLLAKQATDAHNLKVAVVDIAQNEKSEPCVLDMNTSPDLSFRNIAGERLTDAVAQSITNMMTKELQPQPTVQVQTPTPHIKR